MNPEPRPLRAGATDTHVDRHLHKVVLRLVKGGPERRAIVAGEVDAVLDPESGGAFLLPAAQRWLLESAPHAMLDGLTTQVCALDAAGKVLSANQAWREAAPTCLGAGLAKGTSFLAACDRAEGETRLDGLALAAGIRQVIAGERRAFSYEHACAVGPGRRWFRFNVTPAAGDRAARAIVSREDITEHRRGERLLALEYAVALALAEAVDSTTAVKAVIRAVCEAQHWDCGRYFRFDSAASVLRCQESWGVATLAVEQFLEKSRKVVLHPGAGLKGRVYRSGQPLWSVAGAPGTGVSSAALAPASDRDGAFIFPVLLDSRSIGVLAFSGPGIREPDDRLLHTVRAIGSQLGRFLHRQQALDALRHSEARFHRLTELSTDWYWEQDREFRFTDYVGTGVLGTEAALGRALWDFPNLVPASGGWAEHRAQLGERWSFCDFEVSAVHADGSIGHYIISGEPVFDAAGAFTGYWGTGLDITQRKLAEIAWRESEGARAATGATPP